MTELEPLCVWKRRTSREGGEIPFEDIAQIIMEDTKRTRHRRARKYRNAKVLEISTTKGSVNLFAIPFFSKARDWEKVLYDFTKHRKIN